MDPEDLQEQVTTHLRQGNYEETLALCQQGLAQDPNHRPWHWYLGLGALLNGQEHQAQQQWQAILTQANPEGSDEIHVDLLKELIQLLKWESLIHLQLGKSEISEILCWQILALNPSDISAYLNLAQILEQRGTSQSLEILDRCARVAPDHPNVLFERAILLRKIGKSSEVSHLLQQILSRQPDHAPALEALLSLRSAITEWHFAMMNDQGRNLAYQQAIQRAVTPKTHVLDIGTGAGLLALMAAQAGAQQVTTCEAHPTLATQAEAIIAANGYQDQIRIIAKRSTELALPKDLDRPADVIVTETFSADLFGEGAVPSLLQAQQHFSHPQTQVIPQSAVIYLALIESSSVWNEVLVDQVCGFDLSAFNSLSWPHRLVVQLKNRPYQLLCDPVPAVHLDFTADDCVPSRTPISLEATRAGRCHGVACWFELILDEHTRLNSGPLQIEGCFQADHWGQVIHCLNPARDITYAQTVNVILECHEKYLFVRSAPQVSVS